MLNVQEFLLGITVVDGLAPDFALSLLTEEYAIKVKQYDDRCVLNYSQIDSPKNHPLVDECRGLILSYPEFNVVAKGYARFFNVGENGYDGPTNYNDWSVQEKCDGSYISIYHYKGNWELTTRGVAFGESVMAGNTLKYLGKENMTYREAVLKRLFHSDDPKANENDFQEWGNTVLDPNNNYCYEYCALENQIVRRYDEFQLVMHGIFDKRTCEFNHTEYNIMVDACQMMEQCGFKGCIRPVKEYRISSKDELDAALSSLTDLDEGFVLVNNKFGKNGEPHRVKLKDSRYLVAHKIRGDNGVLSVADAISLFLDDGGKEYIAYFPDDAPLLEQVKAAYEDLVYDIEVTYNQTCTIDSQKDFALQVKDTPYSAILFQCRAKKQHPRMAFLAAKDSLKVKLIELYWNKLKDEGEL